MEGYLCDQSRPVRVSSWALPWSRRACMRYPSYLISCSQSGPCGGASTSLQSCGLTHLGRPGDWLRGLLFIEFAITAAREALISIRVNRPRRVDMPRASWRSFLRLSLVSCPIYLSPATSRTKPIRLHQVWQPRPIEEPECELADQGQQQEITDASRPSAFRDDTGRAEDQSGAVTRITLRLTILA